MYKAEAIHFGHEDIGNDERRFLFIDRFERFHPVSGGDHTIAFEFEGLIKQYEDIRYVFNDQQIALLSVHTLILPALNKFVLLQRDDHVLHHGIAVTAKGVSVGAGTGVSVSVGGGTGVSVSVGIGVSVGMGVRDGV